MGQALEKNESEILERMEDLHFDESRTKWLPAGFGQREAQLRELHGYTMQDLADRFGTSVSTISRLENGMGSTISLELLSGLADLYGVSADFLLGKAGNPERMYFTLEDIGLSPKAGLALYSGRAAAEVVSMLLENRKFDEVTHQISDYVVRTEEGFDILLEMTGSNGYDRLCDYSINIRNGAAGKYFRKFHGMMSGRSLDSITDGLRKAVKELKDENDAFLHTGINFTAEMLLLLKETYPKGCGNRADARLTPGQITDAIAGLIEKTERSSGNGREFIGCLRKALGTAGAGSMEGTEVAGIRWPYK